MIQGAKNWDRKETVYFVQTNNPTEERLRKVDLEHPGVKIGFLESCGNTAAVMCLAAVGAKVEVVLPGRYRPQPEEVLGDWFHDPANYARLKAVRRDVDPATLAGNRVPQYYPLAVRDVFGFERSEFDWIHDFSGIVGQLRAGSAVQLCLKKPGHYVAAVAYDNIANEIIYHDPWPNRHRDGTGFGKRLSRSEYLVNIQPYAIVYGGEK